MPPPLPNSSLLASRAFARSGPHPLVRPPSSRGARPGLVGHDHENEHAFVARLFSPPAAERAVLGIGEPFARLIRERLGVD